MTRLPTASDARVAIATRRDRISETLVVRDTLPSLRDGEIRLEIDALGLSSNNVFYAQMGSAPFLRFASVYPVAGHEGTMFVPAWGVGTVVASANPDFAIGERYRGFLHLANLVQLRARKTADGFVAADPHRKGLVGAYNTFVRVQASAEMPFTGDSEGEGLALSSAPSALSGALIAELLAQKSFYGADAVAITSASAKIALSLAVSLEAARASGSSVRILGYTSPRHADFVRSTGLYDDVVLYDTLLPGPASRRHVLVDIAGDAGPFRRNRDRIAKALAVGGTHGATKNSIFAAFGPSAMLKLVADVTGSPKLTAWTDRSLHPQLEMFFAPTIMADLIRRHGKAEFDRRSETALVRFAERLTKDGHIAVHRCETPEAVQDAYRRVFAGTVPPDEAILVTLRA